MEHITILFRGGQCGNYLGINVGKYITNRITNEEIPYDPVSNEYFTSKFNISKYNITCSHINLLDNFSIEPFSKIIIINNNWNICYTETLGGIKFSIKNNKLGNFHYNSKTIEEFQNLVKQYNESSKEFKQKEYDVFDLEFKDLFIDKNKNKYIGLCNWLDAEYSNAGYLHLCQYVDKNTALMEKYASV